MFMSDVSIIVRKMRAVAQAELGDYNIGFPEQLVIMFLKAKGPSNQASLAEELEIDKGSIAKTLEKLENKGLVHREENPASRREKRVELTPVADEILQAMRAAHKKLDAILFDGLTDEEVEATCRALSIISNNLVMSEENGQL